MFEKIQGMKFYFHPEAERELYQAIAYYEERRNGLGLEFAEEIYAAIFSYSVP